MSAALACRPASARELREALRQSLRIDLSRLDRVLGVDAGRDLVEAQAAASWPNVLARLGVGGGDVGAWADLGTVGAAVEQNSAGPDGRPVGAHVEALTLVGADGELRRVSREAHAEFFELAVGGQGLFGALYSVTLRAGSLKAAARQAESPLRLTLRPQGGTPSGRPLEVHVPPAALEDFLARVRACCADWHAALEAVEVRRLRLDGRALAAVRLGIASRRSLGGAVRAAQIAQALIRLALESGGTLPRGSLPLATRAQALACEPALPRLLAEARRTDPRGRFENEWSRAVRGLLGREACEVRFART